MMSDTQSFANLTIKQCEDELFTGTKDDINSHDSVLTAQNCEGSNKESLRKVLNPLSMEHILPYVFRYLQPAHLKSIRAVSSTWAQEGARELIKTFYIRVPPQVYECRPPSDLTQLLPISFQSFEIPNVTISTIRDVYAIGLNSSPHRTNGLRALKFKADSCPGTLISIIRTCPGLVFLDVPPTPTDEFVKRCDGSIPCPSSNTSSLPNNYTETLVNTILETMSGRESPRFGNPLLVGHMSLVFGQLMAIGPSKLTRLAQSHILLQKLHLDLFIHVMNNRDRIRVLQHLWNFTDQLISRSANTLTELSLTCNNESLPPRALSKIPVMPMLRKFSLCLCAGVDTAPFQFPLQFQLDSNFPNLKHLVLSFSAGHFHTYTLAENVQNLAFLQNLRLAQSVSILEFNYMPLNTMGILNAFTFCPKTEHVKLRNFFDTGEIVKKILESNIRERLKTIQIHLAVKELDGRGAHLFPLPSRAERKKQLGSLLEELDSALNGFPVKVLRRLQNTKLPDCAPFQTRELRSQPSILDCPVLEKLEIIISGPVQTTLNPKFLHTLGKYTLPFVPELEVAIKACTGADIFETLQCPELIANPNVSFFT